tara:strand:- start:163255 stop:164790 length:1536 start_codon:yes stop_codon:yes gene_type:complete
MKYISMLATALFILLITSNAHAQNFGVIKNYGAVPGYNLFTAFRGTSVYLMDNDGQLINEWVEPDGFPAGANMFLNRKGHLIRTIQSGPEASPYGAGAGLGGLIRAYRWDGSIIWEFPMKSLNMTSHHTMIPLPNGNVLVTAYSTESCVGAEVCGESGTFRSEKLIELKPKPKKGTAKIVWEWNLADHLLPIGADSVENAHLWGGEVGCGGPGDPCTTPNINHLDYDPHTKQILMSCNTCDEIWVIEKQPTTRKAAKNKGGRYGKGGGFIYRYGNRGNYNAAAEGAGTLQIDLQHGVRFVKHRDELGWTIHDKRVGNIILYNNGFSTTDEMAYTEIKPVRNRRGGYKMIDGAFQPLLPTKTSTNLGSPFMGSVQALPYKHTIINAGVGGTGPNGTAGFPPAPGFAIGGATAIELDKRGHEVWRFVNPVYSTNQGGLGGLVNRTESKIIGADCPIVNTWNLANGPNAKTNWMFRMLRYSKHFPGFRGKNLHPKGLITDAGTCVSDPPPPPAP